MNSKLDDPGVYVNGRNDIAIPIRVLVLRSSAHHLRSSAFPKPFARYRLMPPST
jgi:hypothetical protein